MQGGSHSYGLETPQSDLDWRGVYANTDLAHIVGIRSGLNDSIIHQNEQTDEAYWELRRFLNLLRQGNTQAVEMLFAEKMEYSSPEFELVRDNRHKLLDTKKLFVVLSGYATSERRLANGERTGKLGGKRKEAIDKYGFSPKNFVQLFRLLWAGSTFFSIGHFPVSVKSYREFHEELMAVKTTPEKFKVADLNKRADELEAKMIGTFDLRDKTRDYVFDEKVANDICCEVYEPLIVAGRKIEKK